MSAREKRKIRPASLQEHLSHAEERRGQGKFFPESLPEKVKAATEDLDPVQAELRGAGAMDPEERAEMGGAVGAFLGNKIAGAHGSLIGAAIGSDAARGLGMAQSGEAALSQTSAQVLDAYSKLGIVDDSGAIAFSDGEAVDVSDAETPTLINVSPSVQGSPKRTIYDIDKTNPLTKRTSPLSLPLAYYTVGVLAGQSDFQDELTSKAVDRTATMLTNALQEGASSPEVVRERAREIVGKMQVSLEQMKEFFYANRKSISGQDAEKIKGSLSILYGK